MLQCRTLRLVLPSTGKSKFVVNHWTRIYPIALMCLLPLSGEIVASFPHVFESSCKPPVPYPILESQVRHSFSLFAMMPILAFDWLLVCTTLNPSLLQPVCSEACGPIRDFHLSRPSETFRYTLSAISAYNELALWRMTTNLVVELSLIPRQIFEKCVSQ